MKEKNLQSSLEHFAPLHQGHIDLIQKAKRSYDKVRVVVSGYQGRPWAGSGAVSAEAIPLYAGDFR